MLCNEGFELANFQCISSSGCPNNYVLYKDQCVTNCPPGTYNKNGFCLRICPPSTKLYGFGCYSSCPSLSTPDACVSTCPIGFTQDGNQCMYNVQPCGTNQYYNFQTGNCMNCQYPCSKCLGNAVSCTDCVDGFVLSPTQSICIRSNNCPPGQYSALNGCLACPEKCGTCINADQCDSCASGYTNTGSDCIRNQNQLTALQIQLLSATRRDDIVFVNLQLTMIPNGLPLSLQGQIMLVIMNDTASSHLITMWVEGRQVWVAIKFDSGVIPTTNVYFIINDLLTPQFTSAGFNPVDAFAVGTISANLALTPPNIQIPARATYSTASEDKLGGLKSRVASAIRENRRHV